MNRLPNVNTAQWRKNPNKPAFRLSDLKERTISESQRWHNIVSSDKEIVAHIRRNQDTMRLTKLLPTWTNFATTSYWWEACHYLDERMRRKYRAWWELLFIITEHNQDREAFAYAYALLLAAAVNRKAADRQQIVTYEAFKLPEARAAKIREAVLSRFEALTLS